MSGTGNSDVKVPENITQDFVANILADNAKYRRRLAHIRENGATDKEAARTQQETMDEMNQELTTLRAKTFLTSGQVAVKKEDADALAAFRAIDPDPAKVAESVKKKGELEVEVAEISRAARFEKAAKLTGYKGSVLTKLAKSENFDVEERTVTEEVDGERVERKAAYARVIGDDKAEWLPLDKFAEKNLSEFLPSLRDATDSTRSTEMTRGREFPRQASSERSTAPVKGDEVQKYVSSTYTRPSERNKAKS